MVAATLERDPSINREVENSGVHPDAARFIIEQAVKITEKERQAASVRGGMTDAASTSEIARDKFAPLPVAELDKLNQN